jgi:hypothetical protein
VLAVALTLLSALALASASALEQQLGVAGTDAFGFSVAVQGDTLVIGTLAQGEFVVTLPEQVHIAPAALEAALAA